MRPRNLAGQRAARGWTVWTPVCAAVLCLALAMPLGLVTPRSRIAAEPPSASAATSRHEPPPSPLVAPRPPERVALAPRSVPARESASAVDAETEPEAPLSASDTAPPPARLALAVRAAGQPAADAWVELVHEGEGGTVRRERADAHGRLALELAPGALRVVAWSADAAALPQRATLVAGHTEYLELALEPAFPVEGRVLDAASGAPLAGAEVAFWTFAESDRVRTDAQGRFRHPRFPAGAPAQQIVAEAPGHGRAVRYLRVEEGGWKLAAAHAGEASVRGSGTPFLELALVPELVVRGRVLDTAGAPLADARVAVEGFFHAMPSVAARDAAETRSAADGSFALAGLRSDVGHALLVEAAAHAVLVRELAPRAGVLELGELALAPEAVLAGAVFDASGWPVADAEVVLRSAEPAAEVVPASALDVDARIESRERRVRTDEHGAFVFEHLGAGPVRLEVATPDARADADVVPGADGSFPATSLVLAPRTSLAGGRSFPR